MTLFLRKTLVLVTFFVIPYFLVMFLYDMCGGEYTRAFLFMLAIWTVLEINKQM